MIIYITLVFKTRGTIPSESNVLQVANTLLNGMKLRIKRDLTIEDRVNFVNVTYTSEFFSPVFFVVHITFCKWSTLCRKLFL